MHQQLGIGLRKPHYDALLQSERSLGWLEFVPENFLSNRGYRSHYLQKLSERYALIPHGVALSVGGPDALDLDYLRRLKALVQQIDAPYFSDHLCFARAKGIDFYDLLPLPFNEEAVHWVAQRARQAMDFVEKPLLLENITYYAEMPGSELSEGEFITAVLEESGASLLLDVNNAYLNAVNHKHDLAHCFGELPIEKTKQIHIAGHVLDGDLLLDSHGAPVAAPVWDLYEKLISQLGPIPTLLEWDANIPELERVLDEAEVANSYFERGLNKWRDKSAPQHKAHNVISG